MTPTDNGLPPEFKSLAKRAPVSIMHINKQGVVSYVNDWHLAHFARGMREKDYFIGKPLCSLPGIDSAGVAGSLAPVLQGQDILLERVYTPEFSGGQSGYQTIRATPLLKDGKLCGAVVIREDVTRWVEMERIAISEHNRLRDLLNATTDSAVLIDANGRFVALNDEAARRRSMTVEELLGKCIYKYLDPEVSLYRRAMCEKVLAGSGPVQYEEKHGDRIFWVSIYPVPDSSGAVTLLASFSREITERKHMERALIRARERAEASFVAKTQFLANISHELRTPLNGILGAAQLAQSEPLNEEQAELWQIVGESGERLLQAINSLLDLADISSHALQASMKPFDLHRCVASVVMNFAVQARLKGLELSAEIHPSVPVIVAGDEFRLRQILVSLLSNAIQCTDEGHVLLSLTRIETIDLHGEGLFACEGGLPLLFTVEDTGVGIPADRLPHIFESFSLAEDTLTKRYSGSGVGLAISKGLVELLGGRIWAESTPGMGSTFSFTVSFWQPGEDVQDGQLDGPCGDARVLIVEDEHNNRVTAARMLSSRGYTVLQAENGQQALQMLRTNPVDVILMDIQMPVMDGITTTQLIRNGELHTVDRAIPIIALTAYATHRDRLRFLREGMNDFVTKPFKVGDLTSAIEKALARLP
ncbi:PAS domain-containing hybrid sensor histidine kinase/response regulator [Fundidesulfovibrio soli]|uniref:PAS domain-containing hybrid sensor histidine kinase/response regulator n=1 Tax=Fundidesulfovibrio soli TaxID=2922716 RepID=UPI001FB00340|nr:PAS domain-containing hybrid sensor histidine kinase/response regulator [Fundidesulfovibrio soli]